MSTIQRITGTNSGLDVDALVKSAMQGYQTKIDKEVQNKKVMEYQQEQYKKIMSDASDFYDKYFDVLKSGNLMSLSNYQTETFTSTDGTKVTAKGLAGASLDNYTVNVTQLAAKATDTLSVNVTGNQTMKIGTAEISFQAVSDGNTTISNYNAAIEAKKKDLSSKVTAGSATLEEKTQLADLNNNTIIAKYSEFSKSITFTASAFGGSGFTLGSNSKAVDKYLEATIKNSTGAVYTINSIDKKTSNTVTIDNVQFDFKSVGASTSTTPTTSLSEVGALNATDLATGWDLNPLTELKALDEGPTTITQPTTDGTKKTITTSSDGKITTIRVTTASGDTTTTTTDTTKSGITSVIDKDGIITTTDISQLKNTSGYTLKTVKVGDTTTTTKIDYNGTIPITKQIETSGTTTTTTTTLKSGPITTVTKEIKDGTSATITSTTKKETPDGTITTVIAEEGKKTTTQMQVGVDGKTTKTVTATGGVPLTELTALTDDGTNVKVVDTTSGITTLTSSDGTQTKILADGTVTTTKDGITTVTANGITTTTKVGTDGSLTTTIKGGDTTVTTGTSYNGPTSLSGSTDVSGLKDKIVKFVDDYNTLLLSINTKIFETRDKDYMPLTDAQKDAMTESQVAAWEKKAQTGLLRKDSDLERIASEMKSAMSTVISGSGLSLEKIGISPVKNYADKNGMLTVDEDKLTKALEESGGDVRDLFTRAASDTDSGGALTKLRSALYSEFKKSTSLLSKKAGLSGTSTESDNTLTENIYKKKLLIADMNKSFADKENALYKKYSDLETVMQRLNSQQSSLASMLGK